MELLADLTLVLLAALAGGFIARRLGQPLIVGYIIAGIAIGPFTGGATVDNVHDLEQLAEVGVALLLFSLGLEVSFSELAPVRLVALAGATIQIVLTIALGAGLAIALSFPWQQAMWFGALISLSSTMVALKTIQAQGRLGTLSSRVMLGLLVVQDLAVVPFMIVLPELSDPGAGLMKVVPAALRAIVLLAVIVFVSTKVVPRLMTFVARWNSRELFLLATTTLALGVGYLTWKLGLSLALGAFVAGLVITESEYAHQALSDIGPLRDLFGMFFFVSVGMLLDPALVWGQIGALTLSVAAVLIGKGAILAGVVRAFGYRNVVPFAVGLTLFQVGEFAFVLARVGVSTGAIGQELYALTLNTAIATMAMTPAISGLTTKIYARFQPRKPGETLEPVNVPKGGLADHVIIAGSGRVGRGIAEALAQLKLPYLLLETDDRRVQQAKQAGRAIMYGDASQPVVLEAAGVHKARAMIITVPSFTEVRTIVFGLKTTHADLPIIARAESLDAVKALYELGIQEVTSPEFEAAIEMTRQALIRFNLPAHEILQVSSAIRRDRYGIDKKGIELMGHISDVARQLDFTWLGIPANSPFAGKTLRDLRLRTEYGTAVVGIIHAGGLRANPDGDATLESGDLVAILGTRDQIANFEKAAAYNQPS
jgi:CPA2 family monovalent cation:H+ antiporter-2